METIWKGVQGVTTRYSPALLAAIRAGELIDENKYGLGPGKPRDVAPLTLTSAMRAERTQNQGSGRATPLLRRGQFSPKASQPGGRS